MKDELYTAIVIDFFGGFLFKYRWEETKVL